MIDNRELYGHLPWERNCIYAFQPGIRSRELYAEANENECHAFVMNAGYKLVYSFGSKEQCIAAVDRHNKNLGLRNLLLGRTY